MPDVTRLLNAIDAGDLKAVDQLLLLVYEELRTVAAVRMANEKAGQMLQPTVCYMRRDWRGRDQISSARENPRMQERK